MINKILNKKQILIWIVSLMPLLLVMALYHRLPDQIPTNWGVNGEVTYGGKQTVWLMAGLIRRGETGRSFWMCTRTFSCLYRCSCW